MCIFLSWFWEISYSESRARNFIPLLFQKCTFHQLCHWMKQFFNTERRNENASHSYGNYTNCELLTRGCALCSLSCSEVVDEIVLKHFRIILQGGRAIMWQQIFFNVHCEITALSKYSCKHQMVFYYSSYRYKNSLTVSWMTWWRLFGFRSSLSQMLMGVPQHFASRELREAEEFL